MKRSLMVVAFAALLAGCAGVPDSAALSDAEKECRKIDLPGSNITKRECKTKEEWAKHDSEEAARNAALLGTSRQARDPYTMR